MCKKRKAKVSSFANGKPKTKKRMQMKKYREFKCEKAG